jgi:hypothetical protein
MGAWPNDHELPSKLAKAAVLIQTVIKNPVLFVPISQILCLIAAQE